MIRILVLIGQDKYLEPLQNFFRENTYAYKIIDTGSCADNILPVITGTLEADSYNLILGNYRLGQYPITDFLALFKGIPLVVMAGLEDSGAVSTAMECGAANYIITDPGLFFFKLLPVTITRTLQFAFYKNRIPGKPTAYFEYRNILQELPDIVYKIDPHGYFEYINPAVKILGYKPDELTGKHFKVIIHPDDYKKVSREEIVKKTGNIQGKLFDERRKLHREFNSFEIRLIPKTWKQSHSPVIFSTVTILAEVNARGHYGTGNSSSLFLGTIGIIRNITHQKKSEVLIRKLYKIMHQSPVAILITDSKGEIEYVNPHFLNSSGFTHKQIIHKHIDLLKTAEIVPGPHTSLSGIILSAQVWQGEILNIKQTGETYWESVFVNPIHDLEGKLSDYLIIKIDINELKAAQEVLQTINDELDKRVRNRTMELEKANSCLQLEIEERKRAEEEQRKLEMQLLQSQKMETIGTLAGGIAHDFNNILTPILGFANIALLEIGEKGRGYEETREVIQAARYARQIVQQILTFASVIEPHRIPLDITGLVNEAVNMVRATLPSTIQIRIRDEAANAYILANPAQVHQVLMNLCANAAYAMKDQYGILEIRLSRLEVEGATILETIKLEKGKYIRLDVCDTGVGIKKEIINRIFDPFFTTKDKRQGTGLGLSVVHGIVTSHGGKIAVISTPGTGTRFSLYFPVYGGKKAARAVAPDDKTEKGNERILLVDDEEKVGITIEKMLSVLGYKVTRSDVSLQALEEFKAHPGAFDLVISDYTMPDLTGLELAVEIHKICPGLPVLLTTGYGDSIRKEENTPAGINTILMKPFTIKELSTAVHQVLKERKIFKG